MRDNQPVTQREVPMRDDAIIVSRTDAGGRIQFVNQDFLEIAGFSKEELIGQPHNIIRHPDMPKEAFADLWRDLKAGLPWTGYVKNRTKSGDHYWVRAKAMPVIENGEIKNLISIRSKPDPETVRAVEAVYKDFREGKQGPREIVHGEVLSQTRQARRQRWFARFGNRIISLALGLCCMIALTGGVGILVANKTTNSLRTVYEDRTVPAGQLADIKSGLYGTMLHLSLIANGQEEPAPLIAEIEQTQPEMQKIWKAYMATYLTPEEEVLAHKYAEQYQRFETDGVVPALALAKAGKRTELAVFLLKVHQLFDAAEVTNHALLDLQMRVAQEEYAKAHYGARIGLWVSLAIIVLGLVVAIAASERLRKALLQRLTYVDSRLGSIMGGNYQTDIVPGHDELQTSLRTIEALQARLSYYLLEKKEQEQEKWQLQQKLADDFNESVKTIVNMVSAAATQLSQTAQSVVQTVGDSTQKAAGAAQAATTTSSNVQTVAAAAEELSASVREISSQLQKTNALVQQSRERTERADAEAGSLSTASDKVAQAMEMIAGIARQINLLALNATIEAARAGDAGKGFAVVASEVKGLAAQADKTVAEIQHVTQEMRSASSTIIGALREIGESVGAIAEASSSVASAVEEQSATTNEIASSMQTAARGTETISSNLKEVQTTTDHAGAASEQILQASLGLSQQAESLNTQVDAFLGRIRAA